MILVTGATGHIGNVLVRKLVERGEKVRVLILPGESRAPSHQNQRADQQRPGSMFTDSRHTNDEC